MTFRPPSDDDDRLDEPATGPSPEVVAQQRAHLRRIMVGFVVVVLLLPFAGLGGYGTLLFVPVLLVAAWSLREAMRLRRSVREHGDVRWTEEPG